VAARSGGFPEMVVDGVTGLLVPPEHISRNFTVKAMAENYVAAIQEFGVRGAA
jgi:glycosyltransferase involved in cell wall biosynthesis